MNELFENIVKKRLNINNSKLSLFDIIEIHVSLLDFTETIESFYKI